jgi:hypothetical protein
MQLDRAREAEVEWLLDGDVQQTQVLELSARRSGPTSTGRSPPSDTSCATFRFASLSSPAISTSSCWPLTSPATRVGAKVVLNAFTTAVPSGTSCATSSAEDIPGGLARSSQVLGVDWVRDVDDDLARDPVRVFENGVLDAGVVDREHDDLAAEGVARSERAGRAT